MAAARAYPPAFDRAFAASQQTASRLRDEVSFGRRHSLSTQQAPSKPVASVYIGDRLKRILTSPFSSTYI